MVRNLDFEGVYVPPENREEITNIGETKIIKLNGDFIKDREEIEELKGKLSRKGVVLYYSREGVSYLTNSPLQRYVRKYAPELSYLDGVEDFSGRFYQNEDNLFRKAIERNFKEFPLKQSRFSFFHFFDFGNGIMPSKYVFPVRNSDDLDYFVSIYRDFRKKVSGSYQKFKDFTELFGIFKIGSEIDEELRKANLNLSELNGANRIGEFSGIRRFSTLYDLLSMINENECSFCREFLEENKKKLILLKGLERNLANDLIEKRNEARREFERDLSEYLPAFLESYIAKKEEIEKNPRG